jgi:hypothetical protein
MAVDFQPIFTEMKSVLRKYSKHLAVQADTPTVYSLTGRVPSPFPQHKGRPMWFGSVRLGKAYVSFHLMPLYMNPPLARSISPTLKKRMQGKTCFNFKNIPTPELLEELKQLTAAALKDWTAKQYL